MARRGIVITTFTYDVFLSHSSKDKAVVHQLAQKLKSDGLRVWLDAWEIRAGDNIPAKIEEGLERSYVLVLCMSRNAFGSDWATLESQTFRFRDPLNKERRFIPLRLDDAEPKGSIIQFSYVDWRNAGVEAEYMRLLQACRPNGLLATRNLRTVRKRWTTSSSCPVKSTWNSMAMKPSTSSKAISLFSVAGCTSETRELLQCYSYERLCFLSLYNESVRGNHEACQIRSLDYTS
jgi:hypothetical protein